MATKEEFEKAVELINKCAGTIKSECKYNKEDAEDLAYWCERYLKDYEVWVEE